MCCWLPPTCLCNPCHSLHHRHLPLPHPFSMCQGVLLAGPYISLQPMPQCSAPPFPFSPSFTQYGALLLLIPPCSLPSARSFPYAPHLLSCKGVAPQDSAAQCHCVQHLYFPPSLFLSLFPLGNGGVLVSLPLLIIPCHPSLSNFASTFSPFPFLRPNYVDGSTRRISAKQLRPYERHDFAEACSDHTSSAWRVLTNGE
jgi:hypothetical protein